MGLPARPQYDEDGYLVGHSVFDPVTELHALVDVHGVVVGAADDDGDAYEVPAEWPAVIDVPAVYGHEEQEYADEDEYDVAPEPEDERIGMLQQQLDQLRERVEAGRAPHPLTPAGREHFEALMVNEVADVEQGIGRTLTDRELHQVAEKAWSSYRQGGEVNAWQGLPRGYDMTRSQDRSDLIMERLADADRARGGEPYDPRGSRQAEAYDMSRSQDRVAKAMDAMSGHSPSDAETYDSRVLEME